MKNLDVFYHEKYTAPVHAFDTTRKSAEIADRIDTIEPSSDTIKAAEALLGNHLDPDYLDALRTGGDQELAESNGFPWDEGIWEMAVHSTAGIIGAYQSALRDGIAGSLSSGLHHANRNRGAGFCTANAIPLIAKLQTHLGITAILDFDAHCGGGTVSDLREMGIAGEVDQFDISTNSFDHYQEDANHLIRIARTDDEYTGHVTDVLERLVDWRDTSLVIYNAGVDPYPEISAETLKLRDEMVFEACVENNVPCLFVLAGGYTSVQSMDHLVGLHLNTITAAGDA